MPHDVFVSYSRSDGVQAGLIDAWLTQQGLRPFFDRRELGAGQLWLPDLERAIDHDAAAMIVLCGPQGLGNTQQYEAQLGLARKAREPDFPVIPVLLPGTPDWRWPRGFLSLQTWVSFAAAHDVREDPAALQRLLAAIRQEKPEADAVRGLVCPYKGLDAFQEEDAGLFFGRAEETEALHATIQAHRVAAILGRSGSGKSSLARAGLLPRLRRAADNGAHAVWDSLVLRPGDQPLVALAGALSPPQEGEDDAARYLRLRGMAAGLREETADVLAGLLRHRVAQSRLQVDRLLILVDQGEELFARPLHLLRDAAAVKRFEADAEHFAALLLKAAETGIASVVLTVRSDFFDPLQASPFGPVLKDSLVSLRRVDDLRPCIEGPAEAVGLRFSPGLVERVLAEVGTDETNLPLLQHALKQTWKKREGTLLSSNAYDASGGVEKAINDAAESCFQDLSPEEKVAARRLFLRLVRPGEGRSFVRASAPVPDDPLEHAVMERFADPRQRLLFVDLRSGRPVVDVGHEALIRGWPTLLAWLEQNRERLETRDAVRDWLQHTGGDLLPTGILLTRAKALVSEPGDVDIGDISSLIRRSERRHLLKRFSTFGSAGLIIAGASAAIPEILRAKQINLQRRTEENRTDISGKMIVFSCQIGAEAIDIGPFTSMLINYIAEKEISLTDAIRLASAATRRATNERQSPEITSSLNGEIYLGQRHPSRQIEALVVGNGAIYQDSPLVGSISDAHKFADGLIQLGIPTRKLIDAPSNSIVSALENMFSNNTSESLNYFRYASISIPDLLEHAERSTLIHNKISIFYFAGNGININGIDTILTPINSDARYKYDNLDELVSSRGLMSVNYTRNSILNKLSEKSAAVICIFDICRTLADRRYINLML